MQKAQQRRYKTVAAIWTKKFLILSGNSWTRESVLSEQGVENSKPPGLPPQKTAGQMSQFVFLEQAVPICQPIAGAADHEWQATVCTMQSSAM